MARRLGRLSSRRASISIGIGASALGCLMVWIGAYGRLDDFGYDLLFRHFSFVQAHPDIVLVDIDDGSLRSVGDWPWPRRRYAQLIDTLAAAGAKAILLDLVLSEPTAPRFEHAGFGANYDIDTHIAILGNPALDPPIFDDDELRGAIQRAGNVYLAMYFQLFDPVFDPIRVQSQADAIVQRDPSIAVDDFTRQMRNQLPNLHPFDRPHFPSAKDLLLLTRLRHRLRKNFALDETALTRTLEPVPQATPKAIERLLPEAKRTVARELAQRFLRSDPRTPFAIWVRQVLGRQAMDTLSPDREILLRAFREQRALIALTRLNPTLDEPLIGRIPNAGRLTLPLDKLAEVAKGIGFVTFQRESTGAVVREIPLTANVHGLQVAQLGFLVAEDQLDNAARKVTYDAADHALTIDGGKSHWPLSKEGRTPINWHKPSASDDWRDAFVHIPASRILEPPLNREAIEENERLYRLKLARLLRLRHEDTPAEYADYLELIGKRRALGRHAIGAKGNVTEPSEELASIENAIARMEREALLWLERSHRLYQSDQPRTEAERTRQEEIIELYGDLGKGQLRSRLDDIQHALEERNRTLLDGIRSRVAGKICLIGYTASGSTDLVSSPVYRSLPGVMVHANLMNMVLNDSPIARATRSANAWLIALTGIIVTLLTGIRRPLTSLLLLLGAVLVIATSVVVMFVSVGYVYAAGAVAVHSCVVWACVAAYRQFTEERARRRFQLALAQYTSPAVAARIAESGAKDNLAPRAATVTCFFSDLYGFTSLSERLGAARTRRVLNPYLKAMSEVLIEHGAIINKFIGDGIFAFFNAPIRPCQDYASAACACSLSSLRALHELHGLPALAGTSLRMRIGLSSGEVFVGDYGSDTKLDYTCIGDTVNLGARLERANKNLGTRILTDSGTRESAGEGFVFRRLGRVEVHGKRLPVEVYELVGRTGEIDSETLQYIKQFERLVQCYQDRDWESCEARLSRCRSMRTPDPVLIHYESALAAHRANSPPPEWNRALPLA